MAGRVLVTGGCGFIGSHLVERLVADGRSVVVLDDLSSGRVENLPAGVQLIQGDVACPQTVALAMEGVESCFHLASVASVEQCSLRWEEAHRINQGGSVNVLAAARRMGGNRGIPVVLASSAAVYGNRAAIPIAEDMHAQPLSPYGADKLGSEMHARVAAGMFGARVMALRIFNVFGPRQDPHSPYSGVVSIFVERALAGEDIAILGDGQQTRDFIYVEDVVRCLGLAMEALRASPPGCLGIYNVCGGRGLRVDELATDILAACGSSSRIVHGPGRPGDIRASVGDPSACRLALGFSAGTDLSRGLSATIAWAKARRGMKE